MSGIDTYACHTIKKGHLEDWRESLDVDAVEVRDGRHLRAIGAALDARRAVDRQLEEAVAAAKAAGESWEAIGLVLGTSKQAAHRKFAR